MKNIGTILATSLLSGVVTLGSYKLFFEEDSLLNNSNTITTTAPFRNVANTAFEAPNFKLAAKKPYIPWYTLKMYLLEMRLETP